MKTGQRSLQSGYRSTNDAAKELPASLYENEEMIRATTLGLCCEMLKHQRSLWWLVSESRPLERVMRSRAARGTSDYLIRQRVSELGWGAGSDTSLAWAGRPCPVDGHQMVHSVEWDGWQDLRVFRWGLEGRWWSSAVPSQCSADGR